MLLIKIGKLPVMMMLFMVYKSFQAEFHLVTENYYEEELKYQDRIDEATNASNLEIKPSVKITDTAVEVSFVNPITKGTLHFYRPDNANFDKIIETTEQNNEILKSELVAGRYVLKMNWDEASKRYYLEEEVFISK